MRSFCWLLVAAAICSGQVPYSRLRTAAADPQNWLMYNGNYAGTHYSGLTQINGANARKLTLEWVFQARSLEKFETTPLVVDGVMYLTEAPNNVVAIDPVSGRQFWSYEHKLPGLTYPCCGRVNRGVAIADGVLYHVTHDAKLLALDAKTGRVKWETVVADYKQAYALTHAPLVVKDKVIVGPAGGELGIRGFLAAYDVKTGKEVWRFKIIPEPGEPGHDT